MSKESGESKRSGGSKGVAFNPKGQRNVDGKFKRAALIKLYGLVAILVLTLGLIAILEYAQRSLPGTSKSHFNPFETGTKSSQSTALQTQASEKTNFVTLTKRQVAPSGSTPVAPISATPTSVSSPDAPSPVAPSSVAPSPVASSPVASSPVASSPVVPSSVLSPSSPALSTSFSSPAPPPSVSPPVSSSPPPPPPSNSSSSPAPSPEFAPPCTPGNTALSCLTSSTSSSASTNTTTPPADVLIATPTDIFVPVIVSSVVAPAVCTATATSSPSCTCPFNNEVSNCRCTVDTTPLDEQADSTFSGCQCTFKVDAEEVQYQDCICNTPDTCTTCRAPFDSSGGTSFLTSAACPPVPFQAGCSCRSLEPSELCPNTVQCDCGTSVRAAQCANSTLPAPPPPGVVQIGTTLVANITTPTLVANITTPTLVANITTPTLVANNTSPSVTANSTSPTLPATLLPVNVTSASSSTPAGPIVGIAGSSVFITSSTLAILVPITSSSTITGPNGPTVIPIVITPGNRPAISSSANPQGQTIIPAAPRPTNVAAPIVSLSVGANSAGQSTTVPVTLLPAAPIISFSVGTNSVGQPTTVPVTLNSATQIISFSIGTNSAGQLTTSPVTLSPPTAVPTGVVFFVSNSISTSAGTPVAVAVTLLKATVDPSSPVVTGSSGQIFTVPTALLQTKAPSLTPTLISVSRTSTAGTFAGAGGSGGGGGGSSGGSSGSDPVKVAVFAWPKSKTFLGGYLPVMVAKFYQMGWTSIHNQAQDLAPFNNPSIGTLFGGPDSMSLFTLAPYLVSWAVIPFASDAIFFDTNYGCANPNPATPANPCWPPKMTANTWVIRLLQGFLSVTAAVALALVALWFKKPHGASNDPTSIAAVAAVASHPDVVRDFSCPAETTSDELRALLKGKKYHLDEYQTTNGTVRYGMAPAPTSSSDTQTIAAKAPSKFKYILNAGWKTMALTRDVVYLLYLFTILGITAAYLRDIDQSPIAKMFENSSVGRRIVFATLAAIASVYFSTMERDMQTLAPYMDLQHKNAAPTSTILLRKHTLPLTSFIPMLRNRHFVPALVALVAILSEFLVITLSGLPYRPGQLRSEFYFCAISSLTILVFMLAIVVTINVWRRFLPHLPRKPDNVANVLSYVVGTKMCDDFEGLERLKVGERDRRIRALGKRYGYGKREDGEAERWVVDEGAGSNEVENGLRLEMGNEGLKKAPFSNIEEVGSQLMSGRRYQ